jgi:hypothetical protein
MFPSSFEIGLSGSLALRCAAFPKSCATQFQTPRETDSRASWGFFPNLSYPRCIWSLCVSALSSLEAADMEGVTNVMVQNIPTKLSDEAPSPFGAWRPPPSFIHVARPPPSFIHVSRWRSSPPFLCVAPSTFVHTRYTFCHCAHRSHH